MDNRPVIFVVDDDDMLRSFYARVLSSEGYKVIVAENGEVAFNIIEKKDVKISLAVIDLLMPFRSGWELIESLVKNPQYKNVPIIAITGLAASFKDLEKIKDFCYTIIHKGDFELENFKETVRKALAETEQKNK